MRGGKSFEREILEILPHVAKPSRYLPPIRNSRGKDLDAADVTWALTFPDVAESGYPHYGLEILYHVLNRMEKCAAERAFFPWIDMEQQMRARSVPLTTIESRRPLGDFDIIGITLQYELSYTNVLGVIDLARLAIHAEDRGAPFPLVAGGGPCATNPKPLAPFFDFFLIGDGEEAVQEISEVVRRWKGSGDGKKESLLRALSEIEGVYVPSLCRVSCRADGRVRGVEGGPAVRRAILPDISRYPIPEAPVVSAIEPVHDRAYAEIARGCGVGCRFCQAGYIYRPLRERPAQEVVASAIRAVRATGHGDATLASLSSGDHAEILPILLSLNQELKSDQVALSLPSLRACTLGDEMITEVKRYKRASFTIAPEAGTERMLRLVNKGITRDHVLSVAERTVRRGWNLLKLYFLIGLPTEGDEDVDGIASLINEVWGIGQSLAKRDFRLNVSVSSLVPKPHTPFQWEAQDSIESVLTKQKRIARRLVNRRIVLKCHNAYQTAIEDVLTRGDRRVAGLIESAYEDGARFDEWNEGFSYERWLRALDRAGIDPEEYHRERSEEEFLPWDHIDVGIAREFLLRERRLARAGQPTPFCREECRICGSCDEETCVIRKQEVQVDPNRPLPEVARPPKGRFRRRFRFTKEGECRFLSQLELTRLFRLALRRSELPVAYSQGFHPRVRVTFGRPLPVGYIGKEELIEFVFHAPAPIREIEKKLNREFPDGIRVFRGEEVPLRGPSLESMPMEIAWELAFPDGVEIPSLEERAEQFLASEEILHREQRRGKNRIVNVREDVREIRIERGGRGLAVRGGSKARIREVLLYLAGGEETLVRSLCVCRKSIRLIEPARLAIEPSPSLV